MYSGVLVIRSPGARSVSGAPRGNSGRGGGNSGGFPPGLELCDFSVLLCVHASPSKPPYPPAHGCYSPLFELVPSCARACVCVCLCVRVPAIVYATLGFGSLGLMWRRGLGLGAVLGVDLSMATPGLPPGRRPHLGSLSLHGGTWISLYAGRHCHVCLFYLHSDGLVYVFGFVP